MRAGDASEVAAIRVTLASSASKVKLRDLRINGLRADGTLFLNFGVQFTTAGTLTLDDVRIHGFRQAGISMETASGSQRVIVRDAKLDDNGNGIRVDAQASTGAGSAIADITDAAITDSGWSPVSDGVALWGLGRKAFLRIARNDILSNRVGMRSSGGAQILSAGGNLNFGNGVNGAPTGSLGGALQ